MLEFFQVYLPICIYILLIILLVVGIILLVRLLGSVDRLNRLLDDLEGKVASLNGLFNVIDFTTDTISLFTDKAVSIVSGLVNRTRARNKKHENLEEEDEYYE